MAELTSIRNIGREIERKLNLIGICSAEELTRLGSKEAFLQLKMRYPNVCLVHLYTLQGAIDQLPYNRLPDEVRRDLKDFYDSLN